MVAAGSNPSAPSSGTITQLPRALVARGLPKHNCLKGREVSGACTTALATTVASASNPENSRLQPLAREVMNVAANLVSVPAGNPALE